MPGKILYIEDNAMNMRLVKVILRPTDYEFFGADSGLLGIETAQKEHPDLILLDINMPGMDGVEVCEKLRSLSEFSHTPIIALTAWATESERGDYIKQGFDDLLAKPINRFVLLTMVDHYISQQKAHAEGNDASLPSA